MFLLHVPASIVEVAIKVTYPLDWLQVEGSSLILRLEPILSAESTRNLGRAVYGYDRESQFKHWWHCQSFSQNTFLKLHS